mgnify:CR=1 FL=1
MLFPFFSPKKPTRQTDQVKKKISGTTVTRLDLVIFMMFWVSATLPPLANLPPLAQSALRANELLVFLVILGECHLWLTLPALTNLPPPAQSALRVNQSQIHFWSSWLCLSCIFQNPTGAASTEK